MTSFNTNSTARLILKALDDEHTDIRSKKDERSLFNLFRTSISNQLAGIIILMALVPVLIVSIFIGALTVTRIRFNLQANALAQLVESAHTIKSAQLTAYYFEHTGDNSTYTAAHRQFSKCLSNIVSTYNYYDIFLINSNGQVVYTYAKEDDFGSNLVSGKYADTNPARIFQAALKLKQGEVDFQTMKEAEA